MTQIYIKIVYQTFFFFFYPKLLLAKSRCFCKVGHQVLVSIFMLVPTFGQL